MMFASSVVPPTLDNGKELVEFGVFREHDAPSAAGADVAEGRSYRW